MKLEYLEGNPQNTLDKLLTYMKEKGISSDPRVLDLTEDALDAGVKAKVGARFDMGWLGPETEHA